MKKNYLLIVMMLTLALSATAQQKVRQFFSVGDPTFTTKIWDSEEAPNEANAVANSFTIHGMFCAVGWDFGGEWYLDGVDFSKYDKLVIRVKSVVGNNLTFSIWDRQAYDEEHGEFTLPDNIVEMDEEVEYEVDFTEGLDRDSGNGQLNLSNIKRFRFWNYWDVNGDKTNPENENYDPDYVDENPGSDVTVTISAMYLERTLANGEKDYLDLLTDNTLSFTDEFLNEEEPGSASYIDNTGVLHMNENAEAGFFFDEAPADWSGYKYLCIVPQTPFGDGYPVIKYVLTDADDNEFESGHFRYGFWNKPRAAVMDLEAVLTTNLGDDAESFLESFDTKKIASLKWSLWGGVSTWEYGIAGAWLSNTCPTYSTGFGDGTDNTGDYVIDNSSENTVRTICLPFAAALCGAQVYDIAGIDDPNNPSELYARPYRGILQAGKPYIIRTNSGRNVTAFRAGANETGAPEANGALVADDFTTYYVEADKNFLVLNEDGDTFEAVVEDDIRVNSNTAYIDCSKLAKAEEQENGLVFAVSGAKPFEANGISIIAANRTSNGVIYDLSGRKVAVPTKGIYVKDGKKFIVK